MKKVFALILAALFLQANIANCATTAWHENESKGAKTKILASFYENEQGQRKLIIGVHFKITDGWKIYGNGSDGIGLPPALDFTGSNNVVSDEIFWPQALLEEEQIGKEVIKFSSYKDEVILPVALELKDLNQATKLKVKLIYGLCKEVCIPASEEFSLEIPDEIDQASLQEIQKFFPQKISAEFKSEEVEKKSMDHSVALISGILLALFGGLILNIMPCVLPVLSIKLISILKHSNAPLSRIRFSFISTILGILFCFVIFALLAGIIKATGNSFGWGLQFQNPYFLIFLTLTLVIFTGNLLGLFELNFSQFLATILNKKISKEEGKNNIFIPNFFSGVLAVLLATPCSAPFLGAAISFALAQSFAVIFVIFLAIGVGFAAPYLVLLIAPKLVYFLPKPGAWMNKAKQVMAGLLAATVIWLIYILSNNIGFLSAALVAILSISLLGSIKIKSKSPRYAIIAALVIATFYLPINLKKSQDVKQSYYNEMWHEFDEAEIANQVEQGKIVVVDVTADWCLTCKFNKLRVFHDQEIMEKLKASDIYAMRADITKPDDKVIMFLHKNNRFAIPFNAVYGPRAKQGLLTSELLTKKELLELIEKAR